MSFAKSFKSFVPLRLDGSVDMNVINEIEDLNFTYRVAGPNDQHTIGLIPFADDGAFVKQIQNLQVVNVGQSVKKVNKKKVKRLLKEKMQELSAEYELANPGKIRKFSKEEKDGLNSAIVLSLLPETEVDEMDNLVVVDQEHHMVYILNATKKSSETITAFIRYLTETFPVVPVVENESAVIDGFAGMVDGKIVTRLALGNFVKLEDSEGIVTWTKESLYESQADDLIKSGKQVVSIGLEFDGRVNFVVDTEFVVKSMKFAKMFYEEGSFEATLLLCMNEVHGIIQDLKEETLAD